MYIQTRYLHKHFYCFNNSLKLLKYSPYERKEKKNQSNSFNSLSEIGVTDLYVEKPLTDQVREMNRLTANCTTVKLFDSTLLQKRKKIITKDDFRLSYPHQHPIPLLLFRIHRWNIFTFPQKIPLHKRYKNPTRWLLPFEQNFLKWWKFRSYFHWNFLL